MKNILIIIIILLTSCYDIITQTYKIQNLSGGLKGGLFCKVLKEKEGNLIVSSQGLGVLYKTKSSNIWQRYGGVNYYYPDDIYLDKYNNLYMVNQGKLLKKTSDKNNLTELDNSKIWKIGQISKLVFSNDNSVAYLTGYNFLAKTMDFENFTLIRRSMVKQILTHYNNILIYLGFEGDTVAISLDTGNTFKTFSFPNEIINYVSVDKNNMIVSTNKNVYIADLYKLDFSQLNNIFKERDNRQVVAENNKVIIYSIKGDEKCLFVSEYPYSSFKKLLLPNKFPSIDNIYVHDKPFVFDDYGKLYICTSNGFFFFNENDNINTENLASVSLNSIATIDENIFIINNSSFLSKSSNLGNNWESIEIPEVDNYIKVLTSVNQKILIVSTDKGVYKSNDFGLSFDKIYELDNKNLIDLYDIEDTISLLITNKGIYKLQKNKIHILNSNLEETISHSYYTNSNNTLYCVTSSGLFKSTDGGKSFIKTANFSSKYTYNLSGYINDEELLLMLKKLDGTNAVGEFLVSKDSGKNFTKVELKFNTPYPYVVLSYERLSPTLHAVGTNGAILISTNSMKTWEEFILGNYFYVSAKNKYNSDFYFGASGQGFYRLFSYKQLKINPIDNIVIKQGDSISVPLEIEAEELSKLILKADSYYPQVLPNDSIKFIFDKKWNMIIKAPKNSKGRTLVLVEVYSGLNKVVATVNIDIVGITEVDEKVHNYYFIIYPNPTSDYLEINLDNIILSEAKNPIKIFNTYGECVMTLMSSNYLPQKRIDVSHLPAGVYMVRIGNYFEKFMIVR